MDKIPVHFFVSGHKDHLTPDNALWEMPLSGVKKNFTASSVKSDGFESKTTRKVITIGDYLSACEQFLCKNNFYYLKIGLASLFKDTVSMDRNTQICLYLEKHGAYYHPVRVVVKDSTNNTALFVINGAVSKRGLATIEKEYFLLSKFGKRPGMPYLPSVFGQEILNGPKGRFGFFIGEWFEGFKEFHVTETKQLKSIVIWSGDGSCEYISLEEARPIYSEIAKILTHYYNIETFEQVFPWHHAAGDFIVKKVGNQFEVRLITIRDYNAVLGFETQDDLHDASAMILPGLLIFFSLLMVKMRLDRLDGTGDIMFLGSPVVRSCIEGFLNALEEKSKLYDYGDIENAFIEFFKQFDPGQLRKINENIIESYFGDPTERQIIKSHLKSHCQQIFTFFQDL